MAARLNDRRGLAADGDDASVADTTLFVETGAPDSNGGAIALAGKMHDRFQMNTAGALGVLGTTAAGDATNYQLTITSPARGRGVGLRMVSPTHQVKVPLLTNCRAQRADN